MAVIYTCSFDHYGPAVGTSTSLEWHIGGDVYLGDGWVDFPRRLSSSNSLNGLYQFSKPAWGARGGDFALVNNAANVRGATSGLPPAVRTSIESLRLSIPGAAQNTRLIHFAFSLSALPQKNKWGGNIVHLLDANSEIRATLGVTPLGRLQLLDGSPLSSSGDDAFEPTTLLVSSAPVIQAQTWHFISMEITTDVINPGTAAISVYVGDIVPANLVLSGSGLAFTDNTGGLGPFSIDGLGFLPATRYTSSESPDPAILAIRDVIVADTSGVRNNTLIGQAFVSAQEMRLEDIGSGWAVNHRENIGDGILDLNTNSTGLRAADAAALEIGASDFTFESWVRFHTIPGPTEARNIIAKWRTNDNNRSYRLVYFGSDNTIRWEVSTNGIDVVTVKNLPWLPSIDKWYNVAVVRSAGQTLLFIDGEQIGVPVADANTYFDGLAPLGIGARFDGTSTLITAEVFKGWMDETRLTVGVARYTSDFTPSAAKFGRDVGSDPSFASVVLLLGYDGLSIADESSFGRVISTTAPAVTAILPDDGTFQYQVLNNRPFIDDTYIEAAQTFAEGIFTFDAIPADDETMTVGAKTYRWKNVLALANDVLIGVDIPNSIANVIAAINGGAGEGTLYGTGTTANVDVVASTFASPQFLLRAIATGATGNAIATTETMTDGFFKAATLTGGQDIPADSDFSIERLPPDVTGVIAVQMTTRHYKTDAGSASVRIDLVGPAGAVAAGTAVAPDLNPAWARQIFEEDPDTMANLTPSTMISGRIRFKRTV